MRNVGISKGSHHLTIIVLISPRNCLIITRQIYVEIFGYRLTLTRDVTIFLGIASWVVLERHDFDHVMYLLSLDVLRTR